MIMMLVIFCGCSNNQNVDAIEDDEQEITEAVPLSDDLVKVETFHNSSGVQSITYYVYDDNGNVLYSYYWNDDFIYTLDYYYYVDGKAMVGIHSSFSDYSSEMEAIGLKDEYITSKVVYYYDNRGNKIEDESTDDYWCQYTYDDNDKVIEEVAYGSGGPNYSCTYDYDYDDNGNVIKETQTYDSGSIITNYKYDEANKLIEKTWDPGYGDDYVRKYMYEYDDYGHLIKEIESMKESENYTTYTYISDPHESLENMNIIPSLFDLEKIQTDADDLYKVAYDIEEEAVQNYDDELEQNASLVGTDEDDASGLDGANTSDSYTGMCMDGVLIKKGDAYYLDTSGFMTEEHEYIQVEEPLLIAETAEVGIANHVELDYGVNFSYEYYDFYQKADSLFSNHHWITDAPEGSNFMNFEVDDMEVLWLPIITLNENNEIVRILDYYEE